MKNKRTMLTRWDKWYTKGNLNQDPRILATPHSQTAQNGVTEFWARKKKRILDLACGVGRDSFYLEKQGLSVTGVDASWNGLHEAMKIKVKQNKSTGFVNADARLLPFANGSFEGVYSFGLLHEFTGEYKEKDVDAVMREIERLLCDGGMLVLAVLAGDPDAGLPDVQFFTRQMYEKATRRFRKIEIKEYDDIGCTGQTNYRIWYGIFEKRVSRVSF